MIESQFIFGANVTLYVIVNKNIDISQNLDALDCSWKASFTFLN